MQSSLGSKAMLAKIDRLRELNVGSLIPLPQLVVVGDQSSGKSSVLESLTGFSFPRATGLCTRYATQITCCRDPAKRVDISIIPRPDADDKLKAELSSFKRSVLELDNEDLANVFHEANKAMGIRMSTDDEDSGIGAFSEDILKIEINGPEQDHLTVIDVPGIFRVPTPGLTTEADIKLVENMVKRYMENSRTIILAVMPCNVDIATQEILKLAEAADPMGVRTMGVLTKPDLATENATRSAVLDLVSGKRSNLRLGYHVVKNRSADDNSSSLAQRYNAEKAFFAGPEWRPAIERCGVTVLKDRLRSLLQRISKEELPHVKMDIDERLRRSKAERDGMGPARADAAAQRQFLGGVAARFQSVTAAALSGQYASDAIFAKMPDMRLITRLLNLHSAFVYTFTERAHKQHFDTAPCDEDGLEAEAEAREADEPPSSSDKQLEHCETLLDKYTELDDVTVPGSECPMPLEKPILDSIRQIYHDNRGPEIGTFGGTILHSVFIGQSDKWELLTLRHLSRAIVMVHDYIFQLIRHLCPEEQVLNELWEGQLLDKVGRLYRRAMDHGRFLLAIERGQPTTFSKNFFDLLHSKRAERLRQSIKDSSTDGDRVYGRHRNYTKTPYVLMDKIQKSMESKGNDEQVCEEVLVTFACYYKVARERFVDAIFQQAISHYLLWGPGSPLKAFDPDMVMRLSDEQLEAIAGEDEESKQRRATLDREIGNLRAALKVLRS